MLVGPQGANPGGAAELGVLLGVGVGAAVVAVIRAPDAEGVAVAVELATAGTVVPARAGVAVSV